MSAAADALLSGSGSTLGLGPPGTQRRVAIIGASGYTGSELVRLVASHPHLQLAVVMARRAAGQRLGDVFPHLRAVADVPVEGFDADAVAARADVAFTALPHGDSAPIVAQLAERGVTVLDLSADFRLRSSEAWREWYASAEHPQHPAPDILARAVYGLPEHHRAQLPGATLVAVPGCYPTACVLAAAPLVAAGLVDPQSLIFDAKSGTSGAGRTPGLATHFPEAGEGIRAYKVAGQHRHTPEIEQALSAVAARPVSVLFTPHLVPMSRGILCCAYAVPTPAAAERMAADTDAARRCLLEAYRAEPFVDVLERGALPDTSHVRGSNRVQVTAMYDTRTRRVLAMSALDNLVKGAAGQALQCLNLVFGWPETTGLTQAPLFP